MSSEEAHAFDRVLAEFAPAIRRLAGCYEPEHGSRDDLAQEIAIALWRALPGFRGDCSIRTFVFRIAHNRALTHVWRRGRVQTTEVTDTVAVSDPAQSPEVRLEHDRRSARLRAAIQSLPLVHRQVLTLALEDLSHAEIASVLGIRENAAAVRLTRARQALRSALGVESQTTQTTPMTSATRTTPMASVTQTTPKVFTK
jgi:RNA polymerase sigma factor (sigma-70 family)